jgi:hypothetical protein
MLDSIGVTAITPIIVFAFQLLVLLDAGLRALVGLCIGM